MNQKWRTLGLWLALVVMFVALYAFLTPPPGSRRGLTDLAKDVDAARVTAVRIEPSGDQGDRAILHVALRGGAEYQTGEIALAEAIDIVRDNQIAYTLAHAPGGGLGNTLVTFLPMLLLAALFVYFLRVMKSPTKNPTVEQMIKARIEALAPPAPVPLDGLAEPRRVLLEAAAALKEGRPGPRKFLLSGPPGAGKTQLVRWLAAESNLKWVPLPASDVANVFVGIGAARVRRFFEVAAESGACIALLEDLDALAARRSAPGDGKAEVEGQLTEQVQGLLELCSILDGVRPFPANVLFVATTNRLDRVDAAVIRPGRIDLHLTLLQREESAKDLPHLS